jgi:hypothetical protein
LQTSFVFTGDRTQTHLLFLLVTYSFVGPNVFFRALLSTSSAMGFSLTKLVSVDFTGIFGN